ncbi:MAG: ATP F0F1 synthase subunit B [Paracoccaceae bacterium]|nr:ATP F0F1 synthase subunit B [Paracoccaceae bacterium]
MQWLLEEIGHHLLGGRGSGQVKAGKGFHTAGFDRLRQPNVRGVLISCDVRSEGLCARESMMAMQEHCSRRYPDLFKDEDTEGGQKEGAASAVTNVEDAIAAEAAKEDLANSITRRLAAAEDQIASAQASAVKEVRDQAIDIAVKAASQIVSSQMSAAQGNSLIEAAIKDVDAKLH